MRIPNAECGSTELAEEFKKDIFFAFSFAPSRLRARLFPAAAAGNVPFFNLCRYLKQRRGPHLSGFRAPVAQAFVI